MPREVLKDFYRMQSVLGFDTMRWLPLGTWVREPWTPPFPYKILEDEGENMVISDIDGVVKRIRSDKSDMSMPQFLQFPVETMEDYLTKIEHRLDCDNPSHFDEKWHTLVKEYSEDRDFPVGMWVIGPFGHLRNLFGDENLMYALYDEPEMIHYIMQKWKEFYIGFLKNVCRDVTPDFIMIWEDNCFKGGPLCSPDMFREFMFEPLCEVVQAAKELGIAGIFVDTDGDCNLMIPIYVEAGVNGFYPFECQAGMDIREIRKQYGKQFVIIGGIEKLMLSDDYTEEDMKREVREKVVPMLKDGGYIPMLDHSAPPNISYNRFCTFLEYVRGLGADSGNESVE